MELESLRGKLIQTARDIPPRRTFLRRLLEHLHGSSRKHNDIHFNKKARADSHWWHTFIKAWNDMSVITLQKESWPTFGRTPRLVRIWWDRPPYWGVVSAGVAQGL